MLMASDTCFNIFGSKLKIFFILFFAWSLILSGNYYFLDSYPRRDRENKKNDSHLNLQRHVANTKCG